MRLFTAPLAAARARIAAEDSLHRRVRLAVRGLWDSAQQLESAPSLVTDAHALAAIRAEAVRLAAQALPFVALADTADARLSLTHLMEHGLDGVPEGEVSHVLSRAREAHQRALETLERDTREERQLVRKRQLSVVTVILIAAIISAITGRVLLGRNAPVDLAAGKPFTLSSKWADCHPENNECGGYPTRILFHTHTEQSPWFQLDLGAPTAFSSATIVNRQDMALPLAVPLIIEVSDDGKSFREIARRDDVFTTWFATFPPQTARYVRLRVPRLSTLHLEAVRVHP